MKAIDQTEHQALRRKERDADAFAPGDIDAELDEALSQTFPASDPVSITPVYAYSGSATFRRPRGSD